jgi:polyhydroxybutyrate depolymerase
MHPGIGIKLAVLLVTAILLDGMTAIITQAASTMPTKMRPGDHTLELTHHGLKRHPVVHVPPLPTRKTPVPVVIMFHGGGGKARGAMRRPAGPPNRTRKTLVVLPGVCRAIRRRGSFVSNPQSWNDGSQRAIVAASLKNIDDVGFVNAMLDDLGMKFRIDPHRLYATGFSNGASMTFRVGRELSARLAAIAPVAGSDWLEQPAPAQSLSLLYLTGTADPLNPLEGGEITLGGKPAGNKPPVREFIDKWVKMLGCVSEPKTIYERDGVKGLAYITCRDQAEVVFYTVAGMGHFWPGGMSHLPERVIGKSFNKISATDVIWEFFQQHPGE